MRAQRRYRATRRDASTRALPLLLLCVSLVPGAARAAPAPDEAPAEEPADPDAELLKRVSELYLKGRALFESSEFNAAIELWAQAYAELPLSERFTSQRSRLLLELASAHMRAYEVDGELTHVRKAEPLFVEYLATLDASDASTTATREMVAEQRARVQAILEEERRREAARAAAERDAAARLAAERERAERAAERERLEAAAARDGMLSARARKALLISGAVTTAVGGGLIGVMAYGLYQGDLADQAGVEARARDPYDPDELQRIRIDGENANKLAIGAGVAGGLLAATGVALIVTSRVGRARQLALSPATSPRLLGVTLRGRF